MTAARMAILPDVASYSVNDAAVARARQLIDARQYVLDSDWGDVQPSADDENAYLESHSWDEYAGVAPRAHRGRQRRDQGAVRVRVRRLPPGAPLGLIACVYRAAEWRHKEVELAAHDLLQHLDAASA